MPLDEEGAKWSCEPCIRGHRSSKCQHFDRLMMKVPKAGRPLAKCPHPKGTCSCQKVYAFMVRIPKGSSCVCRPLYKVPVTTENEKAPQLPQTMTNTPGPVPGPSSSNSNRVQKRTKRQNSGRSISDNSMKNLATLSAMQAGYNTPMPSASNLHSSNLDSRYSLPGSTPTSLTSGYQKATSCCSGKSASGSPSVQEQNSPGITSHDNTQKQDCCSRKPVADKLPQLSTSCCSKASSGENDQHDNGHADIKLEEADSLQEGFHAAGTYTPQRSFSSAQIPTNMETFDATSERPVGLGMNTGLFSSSASAPVTGYSSPNIHPQHNSLDQISVTQNFASATDFYSQDIFGLQGEPNHNCGCGPGCQCLGCASHPFNETTRQHIQEMGYLMASRDDEQSIESPRDSGNPPYSEQQHPNNTGDYSNYQVNGALPLYQGYNNPYEHFANVPGTALTSAPAAYNSQAQGQMMMQPNAYVTVEYPVGLLDPCTNMTGTCQCGINCACVGCLTHHGHNGVTLEPSPPPENPALSLQSMGQPSSHESPGHHMPLYTNGTNGYDHNAHVHWGSNGR